MIIIKKEKLRRESVALRNRSTLNKIKRLLPFWFLPTLFHIICYLVSLSVQLSFFNRESHFQLQNRLFGSPLVSSQRRGFFFCIFKVCNLKVFHFVSYFLFSFFFTWWVFMFSVSSFSVSRLSLQKYFFSSVFFVFNKKKCQQFSSRFDVLLSVLPLLVLNLKVIIFNLLLILELSQYCRVLPSFLEFGLIEIRFATRFTELHWIQVGFQSLREVSAAWIECY